jgi:hypothetical protein
VPVRELKEWSQEALTAREQVKTIAEVLTGRSSSCR